MTLQENRVEKAERGVREAQANVDRQEEKILGLERTDKRSGLGPARDVLLAFKELLQVTRQRLRAARQRRAKQA